MKVLFATSELAPLVRVGGLAYAAAGMSRALLDAGIDVTVVMPDYGTFAFEGSGPQPLAMPDWVGITTFRSGTSPSGVPVVTVRTPGMERPDPYTDEHGQGWPDNDFRFMAFAAAVARLAEERNVDILHVNDWHAAAALGFQTSPRPAVLTIHNLTHQGTCDLGWAEKMTHRREAFAWQGASNPMAGAIAVADSIVTVSPSYATEILQEEHGAGLDRLLRDRNDRPIGILNGIDTTEWNPATDRHLARTYTAYDLRGKAVVRRRLLRELGWPADRTPLIGMVTRLTWQKGLDFAFELTNYLERLPGRLALLGSGERELAAGARWAAAARPQRMVFIDRFDEPLAHRIFAGSDLTLVPSRFEPCGLTQLRAMFYGSIPVVSAVGGLRDTVVDADVRPQDGTGFVAPAPDPLPLLDALHRAVRAWRSTSRRRTIQRRAMAHDWNWRTPAARQIEVYESVLAAAT